MVYLPTHSLTAGGPIPDVLTTQESDRPQHSGQVGARQANRWHEKDSIM